MDNQLRLNIPDNFAFVLRAGGANLRHNEFFVSFAIGAAGVQSIALIGHTHCRMVNLAAQKKSFVRGLVKNGGWDRRNAEDQFTKFAPKFEIGNEIDFVLRETRILRANYPNVSVVPMIYKIEDGRLYLAKGRDRAG